MIAGHDWDGTRYEFVIPRRARSNSNQYTVIVGKNGTGKSRLMRSVVDSVLGKTDHKAEGAGDNPPFSRVICVSATPYDKFPLLPRKSASPYRYLGLRGVATRNLGIAYLSRVIWSLLDGISSDPSRGFAITKVLRYLGYQPTFTARFSLNIPSSAHESHFAEKKKRYPNARRLTLRLEDTIRHSLGSKALEAFAWRSVDENSDAQIKSIARSFNVVREAMGPRNRRLIEEGGFAAVHRSGGLHIEFSHGALQAVEAPRPVIRHLLRLLETGFARLDSVHFTKVGTRTSVEINEASSGEQSVLLSLLGLASQITDGSLVCIDEPEVCLHPEWQERYMRMLISTCRMYVNCQFLIATHSPQIVAQLDHASCFVLDMERAQLRRAREVANRSVDFQLATVFDTPGMGNEYLVRLAITLMASLAKKKSLDDEGRERLDFLRHFSSRVERGDPLLGLIRSLDEMADAYA